MGTPSAQAVTVGTKTSITASALSVTIPTGTPGGRTVLVLASIAVKCMTATFNLIESWGTTAGEELNSGQDVRRPGHTFYSQWELMAWIPVSTIGTGAKTLTSRILYTTSDAANAVTFLDKIAILI